MSGPGFELWTAQAEEARRLAPALHRLLDQACPGEPAVALMALWLVLAERCAVAVALDGQPRASAGALVRDSARAAALYADRRAERVRRWLAEKQAAASRH